MTQDHPTDARRMLVHTQDERSCRCVRYLLARRGIRSEIETFEQTGDWRHVSVSRKDAARAEDVVFGFESGLGLDLHYSRPLFEVEIWEKENVARAAGPPEVWCSSYCNHGHQLRTGKPIGHACYVLPPQALRLERSGQIELAIGVIEAAKPLRPHSGVRAPS